MFLFSDFVFRSEDFLSLSFPEVKEWLDCWGGLLDSDLFLLL